MSATSTTVARIPAIVDLTLSDSSDDEDEKRHRSSNDKHDRRYSKRQKSESGTPPQRAAAGKKSTGDEDLIEDDIKCPIEHELPREPVMAEDGWVYENSVLQQYFETCKDKNYTSPITRDPISKRLVPAVQHKKLIETIIRNGYIKGEDAESWMEKQGLEFKVSSKKTSIEEALKCPLTKELPWNAVMAADGYVYERSAIEDHFQSNDDRPSPVTGLRMTNTRLIPALQHRNVIETSIKNGYIQGTEWHEKARQKKKLDEQLQKAQGGDVKAMEKVAEVYDNDGFLRDDKLAYHWFEQAHNAGSILGTASIGYMLCAKIGVKNKNPSKGSRLLLEAALHGSDYAMYKLGVAYKGGLYGFRKDFKMAVDMLERSIHPACPHRDMTEEANEDAKEILGELDKLMNAWCCSIYFFSDEVEVCKRRNHIHENELLLRLVFSLEDVL